MTRKEELLAAFDDALTYWWESLDNILEGISDEEAIFQHPIYAEEQQESGSPPPGCVLWHLVHLTYAHRRYYSLIAERPLEPAETGPLSASTISEAIENMKQTRANLRNVIASLSEEQLDEKHFYGRSIISLARMTNRHDAWHAAQMTVARRLYRMRNK